MFDAGQHFFGTHRTVETFGALDSRIRFGTLTRLNACHSICQSLVLIGLIGWSESQIVKSENVASCSDQFEIVYVCDYK